MESRGGRSAEKAVNVIYRSINLITAALLLTGQLTITAVWMARGGAFGLSLTGDIVGATHTEAVLGTPIANLGVDFIDVITALLLIVDQIDVTGTYIGSGMFSIVVSGPPFGLTKMESYTPKVQEFFADYRECVLQGFRY